MANYKTVYDFMDKDNLKKQGLSRAKLYKEEKKNDKAKSEALRKKKSKDVSLEESILRRKNPDMYERYKNP